MDDRFHMSLNHSPSRRGPLTPYKIVVGQFTTPDLVGNVKWKNGLNR